MGDNPPEKTDMCSTAVGLNTLPQSRRFLSAYRKTVRGAGLQMGCRPSKDGNKAMSMYTRSETDSDYIRQATLTGNEQSLQKSKLLQKSSFT